MVTFNCVVTTFEEEGMESLMTLFLLFETKQFILKIKRLLLNSCSTVDVFTASKGHSRTAFC